jgi:hypothetical protein
MKTYMKTFLFFSALGLLNSIVFFTPSPVVVHQLSDDDDAHWLHDGKKKTKKILT